MRRCQTMDWCSIKPSRAGSQGLRLRRAGADDRGIEQNHRDPPSMLRRAQSLVATLAMSARRERSGMHGNFASQLPVANLSQQR